MILCYKLWVKKCENAVFLEQKVDIMDTFHVPSFSLRKKRMRKIFDQYVPKWGGGGQLDIRWLVQFKESGYVQRLIVIVGRNYRFNRNG